VPGFYDDIADYYDLVYEDWEASMRRQGAAISEMIGRDPSETRVLDVSAGIGTQSLPLASLGYEVVARDLSPESIRRLKREAGQRGFEIDAEPCEMRDVASSVDGVFDVVISMDNSIPHLLTDADIVTALAGFRRLLAPGGIVLISLRDYESVDRSPQSVHPYGERMRNGRRYRMSQHWDWYDASHYCTTMVVEEKRGDAWHETARSATEYYAISIPRLFELMAQSGLTARRVETPGFFQPVVRGCAG
jgi:SAM-dependent methyltransferase